MPHHDTFVLHVWRSHSVAGDQWAARLEHLPDGRSRHFDEPEGLLAYVRDLIARGDRAAPPTPTMAQPAVGLAARGAGDAPGDGPSPERPRTRDMPLPTGGRPPASAGRRDRRGRGSPAGHRDDSDY